MDIEKLEKQVKWSKYILVGIIAAALSAYILRFKGLPFGDEAAWGQFGDYLGGVMNPLIAFGAFYWLATSVLLQKTELADTRKALQASERAQRDHANTALVTARIQSLNIKLTGVTTHINQVRERLTALYLFQGQYGAGPAYTDDNGQSSSPSEVISTVRKSLEGLLLEEAVLLGEIDKASEGLNFSPFRLGKTVF